MAERRMVSQKIIDSDVFLEMSLTAQCLYFHFCIRADDDGFINNPRRIQRTIGSNDDDFKLLLAKGFLIPFDSGVCVVKHWLIHNTIRKDRYSPTQHIVEKSKLIISENKTYDFSGNQLATSWQPDDIPVGNPDKYSIDKSRIGKDSIDNNKTKKYDDFFEEVWKLLPSHKNDRKPKVSAKRKRELYAIGYERISIACSEYLKVQDDKYLHRRDNFFNDIIGNYLELDNSEEKQDEMDGWQ